MQNAQARDVREPIKLSESGEFYRSRDEWIRYVLDRPKDELSLVHKAIAVKIAMTTNPKKRTYSISQARIAKDIDVAEKTVKHAVGKLRKLGLLDTEKRRIGPNTKAFNFYRLVPVVLAMQKAEGPEEGPL